MSAPRRCLAAAGGPVKPGFSGFLPGTRQVGMLAASLGGISFPGRRLEQKLARSDSEKR